MPRERIDITEFNYGQMSEPDPRDIPLGAGTTAINNDPNSYGILRGIYATGSNYHATPDVKNTEWLIRSDGKRDLIYTDNSNIKSLLDFYGTPTAGATISGAGYSFVPQNKKVFIGMGTSTAPKVAIRKPAAKFNGIIARTVGTGADDLIIDSSEYDGTATTYYVKIFNTTSTGTFSSVSSLGGYGSPQYAVFNVSAGHGLNSSFNGKSITLTAGAGAGIYNGVYKFYFYSPTQFMLRSDIGQPVLFNVTDVGAWSIDGGSNIARWKWSTDDSTYYPTAETLSAKEFAKVGTNGLKARFIDEGDKALNDKWTITFSAANSEALYIEDAECYNYQNNESTDSVFVQIESSGGDSKDDGFFTEQKKYFYGWSIIYDNSEESPIAYRSKGNNPTTFSTLAALESVKVDFKITTTSLPERITGFNLWCAEANNSEAEKPETEFRYIQTFNLDGARVSANTYTFKLKDVGTRGLTYENHTGISEVVESTSVKYTLSAQVNDKLFVANCSRQGVDNASHVIFRSKALRYSMFDWTTELLPISTKPTAMASFRGRLLVFDESRLYIIEPEAFFIEQIFNVGCPYSKGVVVTENHIYWADKNAAYRFDGREIEDISTQKIKTDYQAIVNGTSFNDIGLIYDSELKVVMYCYRDGSNAKAWSYHVLNNRWDYFIFSTGITTDVGYFTGKDGETYVTTQIAIYRIFSSSARRSWTWYSGILDCGSPAEDKVFYLLRVNGTVGTIQFKIDDGTLTTVTNGEEIKLSGDWARGKTIQILLTATATTDICYSVTVIYRKLGLR